MYDIIFIGNKNLEWETLKSRFPTAKFANNFFDAQAMALTKMFWAVWSDVRVRPNFNFSYKADDYSLNVTHVFKNGDYFDGICLFPKRITFSQKEIDYRFFAEKKEVDIVASDPRPYDIFYVETWEDYEHALAASTTQLFWAVSHNMCYDKKIIDNFYFSYHNGYDRKENHAFIHNVNDKKLYNGVFLLSKQKLVSKKEIEYRFLVNKKEWNIVVSTVTTYEKFNISTYEDYLNAFKNSKTEMFWMIPDDVIIKTDFEFDLYFSHDNEYDRKINHVFLNDKYYDGVVLCSKYSKISKREFDYRFITHKKEHSIVASTPKPYDIFYIESWEEYEHALANSTTEMFWAVSYNLSYDKKKIKNFYFSHHNSYDRKENHAFIHKVGDKELYNGVFLLSKQKPVSKKEIEYRFLVNKKECDIVVSTVTTYEKFNISTYEDYLNAFNNSKTEMFWAIPSDVNVMCNFKFDLYFSHDNEYDRKINHVFLNGKYHDGVVLFSKHSKISKREFDYSFITHKKEHPIGASTPKPYDIIFISYNEPNADENYKRLIRRFPTAKRVHGVKGIHQAHINAAKLADTDLIWIVDGDAEILDDFNFDFQVPKWQRDHVFTFRSRNPINDLVYGYGGVKLFPKKETLAMDISKPDMTTSISAKFNAVKVVSNITAFNTGPFETWKSAFRECVKLSSKIIDRQKDDETNKRLKIWQTVGKDRPFGEYAIRGATAGAKYGYENKDNLDALKKINDFEWLKEKFNELAR